MKYIDKFLKKLKTDRNTFVTWILTLATLYITVDRIVEIIFIAATGMYVDYWGPIKYTLAIACPVFAFFFSFSSKFMTNKDKKITFVHIYVIDVYIVIISMFIQWLTHLGWLALICVPNFSFIIVTFYDLIKPAFSAIAWYIPLMTFYGVFTFLHMKVQDTKLIRDSIKDYGGIDLNPHKEGTGPYSCEIFLCKNNNTGKNIKIPEHIRYESTLVVGTSGSGKTSMIFEPLIARDLERKFLMREASKEMAYTALRTGLATLNCPYSNEQINSNFSLSMIMPSTAKEKLYKAYMKKLIQDDNGNSYLYKTLGLTYVAPDIETIDKMKGVAENFGHKYTIIDPDNPDSIGLNPFAFDDPVQIAITISSLLKRMYTLEVSGEGDTMITESSYTKNISGQAVENLSIILKVVYPELHGGDIPSLEDLLDILNDHQALMPYLEYLRKNEELAKKYKYQITYVLKNFINPTQKEQEELTKHLMPTIAQIDSLLRYPGVKSIVCNKEQNLDYNKVLQNGDLVFCCTRHSNLGAIMQKSFGLFFLLVMQQAVMGRPGSEKTRTPHFLYIDEFPPFICKATEDMFTQYRKYKVGIIVSAQNLSQLGVQKGKNYRQTILANSGTKIVFGNNTPEDDEWWSEEFGEKREWMFKHDYHTDQTSYDPNYKDIKWGWKDNYTQGKVQRIQFHQIIYKTKDVKRKMSIGTGQVDFLEGKYKEKKSSKSYNFTKFGSGVNNSQDSDNVEIIKKEKFDLRNINFTEDPNNPKDMDPIIMNRRGIHFRHEEGDAIERLNIKSNAAKNNSNNNAKK